MINDYQQRFNPIQFISLRKGKAVGVKHSDYTSTYENTPVWCTYRQTQQIWPG